MMGGDGRREELLAPWVALTREAGVNENGSEKAGNYRIAAVCEDGFSRHERKLLLELPRDATRWRHEWQFSRNRAR